MKKILVFAILFTASFVQSQNQSQTMTFQINPSEFPTKHLNHIKSSQFQTLIWEESERTDVDEFVRCEVSINGYMGGTISYLWDNTGAKPYEKIILTLANSKATISTHNGKETVNETTLGFKVDAKNGSVDVEEIAMIIMACRRAISGARCFALHISNKTDIEEFFEYDALDVNQILRKLEMNKLKLVKGLE